MPKKALTHIHDYTHTKTKHDIYLHTDSAAMGEWSRRAGM